MGLPLFEQARPQTLDDIVGQDKAVATVRRMTERGLCGRVFFISGLSGTGKTTLARIIVRSVSLPYAITEMDAADLSIDTIRDIERSCRSKPIGCQAHGIILNEVHALRGPILARLNTTLEMPCVQANSVFCLTTTLDGQKRMFEDSIEDSPFSSRTIPIRLEADVVAFAERVRTVAKTIDCDPTLSECIALVKRCKMNLRMAIQAVDAGEFASCAA